MTTWWVIPDLALALKALGQARIFTLDSDFHIYRLHSRRAFEVLPR